MSVHLFVKVLPHLVLSISLLLFDLLFTTTNDKNHILAFSHTFNIFGMTDNPSQIHGSINRYSY